MNLHKSPGFLINKLAQVEIQQMLRLEKATITGLLLNF